VRQRRTGSDAKEDSQESLDTPATPVSTAFLAGTFHADQRCGRCEQYSARKAALAATPDKHGKDGCRPLLCTVQRQSCLYFAQTAISF
jgi:hypothetical protein